MAKQKVKKQRDYYKQIDEALSAIENYRHATLKMSWITDRITCWKFRHITPEQKDELVERCIAIFENPLRR